jgi:cytochrome b6
MSVPPGVEAEWRAKPSRAREMPFFPNFLLRELMAWYIALGILGALSALKPWELGAKADPFASAPAGIRPEWYFMFTFQTLKMIPAKVGFVNGELLGAVGIGVAVLVWTLLPFFDRSERGRNQRLIAGVGVFALSYIIGMTVYGYIAK